MALKKRCCGSDNRVFSCGKVHVVFCSDQSSVSRSQRRPFPLLPSGVLRCSGFHTIILHTTSQSSCGIRFHQKPGAHWESPWMSLGDASVPTTHPQNMPVDVQRDWQRSGRRKRPHHSSTPLPPLRERQSGTPYLVEPRNKC